MSKRISNSHNQKTNNLQDRSFIFSLDIIKLTNSLPNTSQYWIFKDQLLRAATSIGANIIEARASSSKRDFTNYYQIALKSSNETEYWLLLLEKGQLCNPNQTNPLLQEVREISKMLGASIITLKGKR